MTARLAWGFADAGINLLRQPQLGGMQRRQQVEIIQCRAFARAIRQQWSTEVDVEDLR